MRLRRRSDRPSTWGFFRDFPRLLPYLRPRRRLAGCSLGLVAFSSLMALLAPWPLAILIDTVLGNQPLPSLLAPLGGLDRYTLLAVAVGGGLLVTGLHHGLAVVDEYVNTRLDQGMVLDLRSDMFRHAQRLSLAFHDSKRTGGLMNQINYQASAAGGITVAVPPLLQAVVTLVGMLVIVVWIEPVLALLAMTVVPFIYMSAGYYARRVQPHVVRVRNLESQSLSIVHEAMAMIRVIVAFGREDHEWQRFRSQGEASVDARVRLTVRQTIFSLVVTMTTAIGTALVLAVGARGVLHGDLSVGELLVVMGYVASLYKPLEQISNTVSGLQQQFITLRGALDLLDTDPQIHERSGARALTRAQGHVTFEDVDFTYPGRHETLQQVSFDAPAGTRVAIIGPTGAGKSTLLSLIPRFVDPRRGCVRIDGHDVGDLTLASLRRQVSMVLQEPLLFSASLTQNIRYGRLDASEEEIVEAARAAGAHDFIMALPRGYATMIGERGAKLSGGERQRISVARAFLRDAPILILDEPTSSIDSRTEGIILDALERLMENRTTFMVAHRLSTIAHADLVLVLDHGRIVEQGTHADLLDRDGLYTELHRAQHGARRGRAAAAFTPAGISRLTGAIAAGREHGGGLEGPALAELARAMAQPGGGGGDDGAWALMSAAWPLLHDGAPDRLRALADGAAGAETAFLARRLLTDLGLAPDHSPEPVR